MCECAWRRHYELTNESKTNHKRANQAGKRIWSRSRSSKRRRAKQRKKETTNFVKGSTSTSHSSPTVDSPARAISQCQWHADRQTTAHTQTHTRTGRQWDRQRNWEEKQTERATFSGCALKVFPCLIRPWHATLAWRTCTNELKFVIWCLWAAFKQSYEKQHERGGRGERSGGNEPAGNGIICKRKKKQKEFIK